MLLSADDTGRLLSVVEGTIDPFASIWQNVLLELDSNVVAYTDMYSSAADGTGITSSFLVRDANCIQHVLLSVRSCIHYSCLCYSCVDECIVAIMSCCSW